MIRDRTWMLANFAGCLTQVCKKYDCWPSDVIRPGKTHKAATHARHEIIQMMRQLVGWRWAGRTRVYCDPGEGGPISTNDLAALLGMKQASITQYINRAETKRLRG